MAYKLAEEDKLCGVIYPTYEGFKPIPKATCEMLESKCEQTIIVKCKDNQSEEDKKPESQSGSASASASESSSESNSISDSVSESTSVSPSESSSTENSNTPEEPKPTPEPQPEPVPTPVLTDEEITGLLYGRAFPADKKLGNVESDAITEINTSVTEPTPEEVEDFKNTVINLTGDIEELKGYNVEVILKKREEDYPKVGEKGNQSLYTYTYKVTKPNGDVYTSEENTIPSNTSEITQYDKLLPNVEPFSKVITKDGQVVEVPEVTEEEKTAYENKVIEELKKKLPEGTTVEAKLEGAKYNKGDEIIEGKTNYDLKVKITKNDVVYEHTYKVPHTEEAPQEEPEAPEVDIDSIIIRPNIGEKQVDYRRGRNYINFITINNKDVTEEELKETEKVLSSILERSLNGDFTGTKRYKVSTKITQVLRADDPYDPQLLDNDTFKVTHTITKPNGEVVEKTIMAYTRSIYWL